MIVVDASVLIEMLLGSDNTGQLQNRLLDKHETLHAPHLVDVEIAQVMRRYVRHGECSAKRGRELLMDLSDMPIERYAHDILLTRIWAMRDNLTAYDATYVALAEALACPLLTMDAKLAGAPGHKVKIELFPG